MLVSPFNGHETYVQRNHHTSFTLTKLIKNDQDREATGSSGLPAYPADRRICAVTHI